MDPRVGAAVVGVRVSVVDECFCPMLLCSLTEFNCFHDFRCESINVLQFLFSPRYWRVAPPTRSTRFSWRGLNAELQVPWTHRITLSANVSLTCSVPTLTCQVYNWTIPPHYCNRKLKISPAVFPFRRRVVYKHDSSETGGCYSFVFLHVILLGAELLSSACIVDTLGDSKRSIRQ